MNDINETETINNIDEPRLFEEDGIEGRVAALVSPLLKPLSYRLIRVKFSGLNGLTLQIMAERADGTMTIEDCEIISRTVSPFLDVQNIIERKYHLEISSPGIDRPLVRKSDFFKWQGHVAKIETGVVINGRQKFRGTLTNITQNSFTLNTDKASYGEIADVLIPFADVTNARLILTDELIRDALKKDKELRQQLIPEDNLNTLTEKTNCQN
ncbi:ribosome maturation factor RimP [Bartonella chomelii]|uniref:Ribosome maturation factor RimP n=1 Tax=Bartonella chomelii TaxID=236402 RepID=A0ABR6E3L9_9HYPH|nr:ribosome maturation factor RimP [Bartonella chomelii]MBA9083019.1 ribosome maturation factor RimP [Bartonella chomelii]